MCQKSSLDDNPYKKPKTIDFTKIEKILRENHKDILLIQLLGGEPLYYPEILKVLALLKELNIAYCITTNGYLLTPEINHRLVGNCSWISISLDAADPYLYKSIRRGGDIESISSNISHLNEVKEKTKSSIPFLNANATIFTYNIHDVSNLLEFCDKHRIKSLSISGGKLYNTPFVDQNHLVKTIKPRAIELIEEAKIAANKLEIIFRVGLRSLYPKKVSKKVRRTYDNHLDLYFEITIQPDLTIAAAGEDYLVMGNLNEHKLEDIWNKANTGYKGIRQQRMSKNN